VNLSFSNVLGGLDELLHGGTHLHGWGMTPFPDQTLYRLRGFDPSAQRFLYDVNPRFGSSSPSTTTARAPFRVTLDVSLNLGRSFEAQQLEQNLRMRPVLVGTRAPVDSIKKRYMSTFSDFYGYLLTARMSDSLALSNDQIRRMQAERTVLRARADSIYSVLSTYLAALPDGFDEKEPIKRITDAGNAVWEVVYAERTFLLGLLTSGQLRLLPRVIFQMITDRNFKGRFFFGF
jgi:hypothetical protein